MAFADWGAVAMGTGIVAFALALDGRATLSRVLLAACALAWVVLVAALAAAVVARDRGDFASPRALTAVAGTAVLGSGLDHLGHAGAGAGAALLVVAFALWLLLLPPVLRGWRTPNAGAAFLVTVATQSLAVLASTLAARERAGWLLVAALALFVAGVVSYPLVAARFDLRRVLTGDGDQWVAGGALAISALAASEIALAAPAATALRSAEPTIEVVTVVVWALALLWLVALVAGEVLRPRARYAANRWATVFPVGMYAASGFALGEATGDALPTRFAQVWWWVAVAVWALVLGAMLRRAATPRARRRLDRQESRGTSPTRVTRASR